MLTIWMNNLERCCANGMLFLDLNFKIMYVEEYEGIFLSSVPSLYYIVVNLQPAGV